MSALQFLRITGWRRWSITLLITMLLVNVAHGATLEVSAPHELALSAGETHVLAEKDLKRIAVGNGKVLSARRFDRDQILLLAQQPGSTTVHLWFRDGSEKRMMVRVNPGDNDELLRDVRRWLGKSSTIEVRSVGGRVVIEGRAANVQEAPDRQSCSADRCRANDRHGSAFSGSEEKCD